MFERTIKYGVPIASLLMYYSDIITDIVVCFDLKEKNSYYFNTSLSIILFSVLGSACLQLFSREQLNRMNQTSRYQEQPLPLRCLGIFIMFLCWFSASIFDKYDPVSEKGRTKQQFG